MDQIKVEANLTVNSSTSIDKNISERYFSDSSIYTGAIALHGPHQPALKFAITCGNKGIYHKKTTFMCRNKNKILNIQGYCFQHVTDTFRVPFFLKHFHRTRNVRHLLEDQA